MKLKTLAFLSILSITPAYAEVTTIEQKPVVYSYWAGWTNADIPDFNFNGLFLAFAFMKKDAQNNYYSDYSASGNFQKPASSGPFVKWNTWLHKFYKEGARAYVSYGGATNSEFRGEVINASPEQLNKMANEIQANIKKYYFDGLDLDIENWWSFNANENQKFSNNLAALIKLLRKTLDYDPDTRGKAIMITVGWNAAGPVTGMSEAGSSYTASMRSFFSDADAVNATAAVNIMSYNICTEGFYSRLDLIGNLLSTFNNSGVPKEKIILGLQPYECLGNPPATSVNTTLLLSKFIKENNYGGLFLWGIGSNGIGKLSSWDYIDAMKKGLEIN